MFQRTRRNWRGALALACAALLLRPALPCAAQAEPKGTAGVPPYATYAAGKAAAPAGKWTVSGAAPAASQQARPVQDVDGQALSLLVEEGGYAAYAIEVPQDGLYTLLVRYYPWEGSGGELVRSLTIDGALPFEEAEKLTFSRVWNDDVPSGENFSRDVQDNDIRPRQIETPVWQEKAVCDPLGYEAEPFGFYLTAGVHTIRLTAVEEPWLIGSLTLASEKAPLPYDRQLDAWRDAGAQEAGTPLELQAERAAAKSDRTLYPLNDRSSPLVSPYHHSAVRYNTIGGGQWAQAGQWLEWELDVPESGLYTLDLRFRQNAKNDDVSYRKLTIDGEVPFAEAAALPFRYDSAWQAIRLGSDETEGGYRFYLSAGKHRLRLEAVLGEYAPILRQMSDVLLRLNAAYRSIMGITGPSPDIYRDYAFDKVIPGTLEELAELSGLLRRLEKQVIALTGKGGQSTAALRQLYLQMELIGEDCATIPQRLQSFQNNLSSLAAWINNATQQPLELDTIVLQPASAPPPAAEGNMFAVVWHYLRQFFSSFFTDYNRVGQLEFSDSERITVWLGAVGRDQITIIQQMVNNDFTPVSGVSANVQLVMTGSLLSATLAGIGPDVSMQMAQAEPMNYALRRAVYSLSEFGDLPDVLSRFDASAVEPFAFDGKTYALPETQSYPMLFYRADILEELGIAMEELDTWDSILKSVLPKLQRRYLQFGMMPNINAFATLLYQNGGALYDAQGAHSLLGSMESVDAFSRYVSLYADYAIPLTFDFANRFRSGEMPVAIADFTSYNQLSVFAPEISGMWGMRHVPGTPREDGTIDYTAPGAVTGCVILSNSRHKEAAWEFLKWWTSAPIQTAYGDELESVMGTAARYPTANLEAKAQTKWNDDVKRELEFQTNWLRAIPELPGSYYTGRNFDFAFRDVVYDNRDQRESLNKAVREINAEIIAKRQEFGY